MYVSINQDNIVKAISPTSIKMANMRTIRAPELDGLERNDILGKRLIFNGSTDPKKLKIAIICNWGDHCGIATYTKYLVDALRSKVGEVKIFAERIQGDTSKDAEDNVVRCWSRGESMIPTIEAIQAWGPDFVNIQHEFGIFPKATYFLKILEMLDKTPYAITLHSVYEHLDKTICTAHIKNIIVHSQEAKKVLGKLGHLNSVEVVPHGCVVVEDSSELWNIFQNNYVVMQFGFGFNYKGVDQAISAINYLKQTDEKFKNIFYCYLCSENPHTRNVHEEYYSYLRKKIEEYDLRDNVVVLRGFLSDQSISNFLRTAKLAIFPYRNDPNNCVYAASGAIRIAMSNGIPVIASDSHLFDDLEGVVPRATDYMTLAKEIDKAFSDDGYRRTMSARNLAFVRENTWDSAAESYLRVVRQITAKFDQDIIRLTDYSVVE